MQQHISDQENPNKLRMLTSRHKLLSVLLASISLLNGCDRGPLLPAETQITGLRFGPSIYADDLANTILGGSEHIRTAYRFQAKTTATIDSVRFYVVWSQTKPGYSAGTGGLIRVRLLRDSGTLEHVPSDSVLGEKIMTPGIDTSYFPIVHLSPSPQVAEGSIYHVVFDNIDARQDLNYVSVNSMWIQDSGQAVPAVGSDKMWSQLIGYGEHSPNWRAREEGNPDRFIPIMDIKFDDGTVQGVGYIGTWSGFPKAINSTRHVRELFSYTGSTGVFNRLNLRIRRRFGVSPLRIAAKNGTDNTLWSSVISASSIDTAYSRVSIAIVPDLILERRGTYSIELSALEGSEYEVFPLYKGINFGFSGGSCFGNGFAQYSSPQGSWLGWDPWGSPGHLDGDLQFALLYTLF
jgi:hypothetical protein